MHHRHSIDDTRLLALLHTYLGARYRWQSPSGWHDLVIGQPAPLLDLRHPEAMGFGLVSAWNPLSVPRPANVNRRAGRALEAALVAAGHVPVAAFSSALDRSWREPGWMVLGMPAEAFDHLARRYGQLGWLWWSRGSAVRLRMDAPRPEGLAGDPDVDWLR